MAKVSEDVSLDKNGMKKVLEDDQDNNHSIGLTDLLNIPSQYGLSNVILSCSSSVVEVSMVVGPFIGAGVDILVDVNFLFHHSLTPRQKIAFL